MKSWSPPLIKKKHEYTEGKKTGVTNEIKQVFISSKNKIHIQWTIKLKYIAGKKIISDRKKKLLVATKDIRGK